MPSGGAFAGSHRGSVRFPSPGGRLCDHQLLPGQQGGSRGIPPFPGGESGRGSANDRGRPAPTAGNARGIVSQAGAYEGRRCSGWPVMPTLTAFFSGHYFAGSRTLTWSERKTSGYGRRRTQLSWTGRHPRTAFFLHTTGTPCQDSHTNAFGPAYRCPECLLFATDLNTLARWLKTSSWWCCVAP